MIQCGVYRNSELFLFFLNTVCNVKVDFFLFKSSVHGIPNDGVDVSF